MSSAPNSTDPDLSEDFDLAGAYASARSRISGLVSTAGIDAVANRIVPATPAWTVHQLVAHLRGEVVDMMDNNLEGAPGDEWTARQVARFASTPIEVLLREWTHDSQFIEASLRAGTAGVFAIPCVMDIHAHEQDLRGLFGMPGERTGPFYEWAVPLLGGRIADRVSKNGLAPMALVTPLGRFGADDASVTLHVDSWEYTRIAFGRRSVAQICRLDWRSADGSTVDAAPYAPLLMRFSPATADLVE